MLYVQKCSTFILIYYCTLNVALFIYFQEGHDVLRTIIEFGIVGNVARIIRYLDLIRPIESFSNQPPARQPVKFKEKRSWKEKCHVWSHLVTSSSKNQRRKILPSQVTSDKRLATPDRFKIISYILYL
jgi:hypothetical protein